MLKHLLMKKNVQVHLLPTDKASKIWRNDDDTFSYYPHDQRIGSSGVPHNLYITTDETPKEGDWYIVELWNIEGHTNGLHLEQCKSIVGIWVNNKEVDTTRHINNCKKVVATDDKSLLKDDCDCGAATFEGCSQCLTGIGKISPEFQQAYVREANKENVIVEAQMEFDEYYNFNIGDKLIVNKDVFGFKKDSMITVESIENEIIHFEEDNNHKQGFHISHLIHKKVLQPKLNEQGYVTILPIKQNNCVVDVAYKASRIIFENLSREQAEAINDVFASYSISGERKSAILPITKKLYTKEEVKQLLWRCFVRDYKPMSPDEISDKIIPLFDTWLKQNL